MSDVESIVRKKLRLARRASRIESLMMLSGVLIVLLNTSVVFACVGWLLRDWLLPDLRTAWVIVFGGAASVPYWALWLWGSDVVGVRARLAGAQFAILGCPALVLVFFLDPMAKRLERRSWPSSMDEAIVMLKMWIGPEGQEKLRDMPDDDLCELHFGLGQGIRNEFGLWGGNDALLAECGTDCADHASGVIIEKTREDLRRREAKELQGHARRD